jgi:metal-sulfur cluster biosynthetic enzyme
LNATTPLESEIRDRLRSIPEPCSLLMRSPTNICDMGLIEAISVDGSTVQIEMVLTDTSCVHFASMRRYIRDVLLQMDGVEAVEVNASKTVLWTPERVAQS